MSVPRRVGAQQTADISFSAITLELIQERLLHFHEMVLVVICDHPVLEEFLYKLPERRILIKQLGFIFTKFQFLSRI